MLAKKFRLTEREVKKVLQKWKPFFSYWIVLNAYKNTVSSNRYGIVIGGKSSGWAICRNFFRRLFYSEFHNHIKNDNKWCFFDYVFVVKKQTNLSRSNEKNVAIFKKEIHFLLEKSFRSSTQKKTWKK